MNTNKLKIGIDFTYIREDKVSGIRKHGEEILQGISKLSNDDYTIVIFVDKLLKEIYESKFPQFKIVPIKVLFKNIRYVRGVYNRTIDKLYKKYIIRKEKCNIVFYPYVDTVTPINKNMPSILSILDLIPLEIIENKESKKYRRYKNKYIKIMNKSKNLVTVSQYSKKRLLDINKGYCGNIEVIPCSVEKLETPQKNIKEIVQTDKYIFSINSFERYKNQMTLVKAFNKIKDEIPHKLVLVGRPELKSPISAYKSILEYIENNKLNDRVKVLSYISDEDRNALFYNADLFVTTSMQEGFGRTPVEAALCEVPVISTRETSLPEATKEMVYYYNNPIDDLELANKILEVLNNKPSKQDLQHIANTLKNEYTQEKIAKKYIKLINNLK